MARVIVYHTSYGCDSGCCGHTVELQDDERFEFTHPPYIPPSASVEVRDRVYREFAEDLVREVFGEEHVADLDWGECWIVDD